MSKIKIKNFGPIKDGYLENDGWIEVKKVTVFIGNQGSGKSTVAKLISTLTWIEKALVRGDVTPKYLSSYNRFVKNYCAYQNIHNYFKNNSEITWHGEMYSLEYKKNKFSVVSIIPNHGLAGISSFHNLRTSSPYNLPKIMYVPAERNFASASEGASAVKGLPKTLYTFIDEFENAINDVKGSFSLPINEVKFEYQKLNKISYIVGNDFKIRLSESSSGFQSFVPLYFVSRFLSLSIDKELDSSKKDLSVLEERRIKKEIAAILSNDKLSEDVKKASLEYLTSRFKNSCFINIVEEPEQNLFPTSQKKILYSLLEFNNMNDGNKLIMTTHSPYLVNYLTLAVKADSLIDKSINYKGEGDFRTALSKVVPFNSVVRATDLVIYELDSKGTIIRLGNFNGIPSDDNYLNQKMAEGNELFGKLLDIEDLCQ